MNEQEKSRRKKIAAVVVILPLVAGMIIVALGHFLGHEEDNVAKEKEAPEVAAKIERQTAAAPAASGTPAPRVRLTNGATGESFDSSSIGGDPYAVVFINTSCEAIGKYLGRAASELKAKGDADAVLAISADAAVDTPEAVSAWVAKHKLKGGPVHYLIGDEDELRGLWNAWGFGGPSSACPPSVPAHLVDGAGENDGIVDLDPAGAPSILTDALVGMAK
jgi:cytochrome oxidase Cu insertion factor (SCO1/SenC/PrrC family)